MQRIRRPFWEQFNLFYHARLSPFRFWRRWLSVGGAVVAAGWAGSTLWTGNQEPYASGVISPGHAVIAHDCAACHVQPFSRFSALTAASSALGMNEACLDCHQGSIGTLSATIKSRTVQTSWHYAASSEYSGPADDAEPASACSRCHVEHRGEVRLTAIDDAHCVNCHADLDRVAGARLSDFTAAHKITHFAEGGGHPNWRLLERGERDPGTIKFNHQVHLREFDEHDVNGETVTLHCDDCHRAGLSGKPWVARSAYRPTHSTRTAAVGSEPDLQDDYMGAIRFDLHCAGCHEHLLNLGREQMAKASYEVIFTESDAVPAGGVPHDTPAMIRTYLWGKLAEFVEDSGQIKKAIEVQARDNEKDRVPAELLDRSNPEAWQRKAFEYIAGRVADAEAMLYDESSDRCSYCHTISRPERKQAVDDLALPPTIELPKIRDRWLYRASFSHEKHKAIDRLGGSPSASEASDVYPNAQDQSCLRCHRTGDDHLAGDESAETSDILLGPGIHGCRECHGPRRSTADGVSGGVADHCTLCHTYHRPPVVRALKSLMTNGKNHDG